MQIWTVRNLGIFFHCFKLIIVFFLTRSFYFVYLNLYIVHMNLKTKLPDGRLILTYIRPGKQSGRLLNLVQHLPWNHNSEDYLPLSRVQVFTSEDDSMSLSMFVYGDEKRSIPTDVEMTGARILDYAQKLQTGEIGDALGPDWSPAFEREALIDYFQKCTESYIIRSNPRRFLKQKELFDKVSGTEDMAISVEVRQECKFKILLSIFFTFSHAPYRIFGMKYL